MVDQLTFQTIFQFLQTISIMVGITYYLMILRNQQKSQKLTLETRQATLMMNIFKELTSEQRWEEYVRSIYTIKFDTYEEFHEKYGRNNPQEYSKHLSLWWTYTVIGLFMEQGLLEDEQVYALMGTMIQSQWERWKEVIYELRKDTSPTLFEDFEKMYNKMVAIQATNNN